MGFSYVSSFRCHTLFCNTATLSSKFLVTFASLSSLFSFFLFLFFPQTFYEQNACDIHLAVYQSEAWEYNFLSCDLKILCMCPNLLLEVVGGSNKIMFQSHLVYCPVLLLQPWMISQVFVWIIPAKKSLFWFFSWVGCFSRKNTNFLILKVLGALHVFQWSFYQRKCKGLGVITKVGWPYMVPPVYASQLLKIKYLLAWESHTACQS